MGAPQQFLSGEVGAARDRAASPQRPASPLAPRGPTLLCANFSQSLFSASSQLCLLPSFQLTTPFRAAGAAGPQPSARGQSGADPAASPRSRVSPLCPAGTGRDRREGAPVPSACPASPQPASKEGRDRTTCTGGAGLLSPRPFPGGPHPGEQPLGAAKPQHLCQELQLGQQGVRGQAPATASLAGPWARPRCERLCPARAPALSGAKGSGPSSPSHWQQPELRLVYVGRGWPSRELEHYLKWSKPEEQVWLLPSLAPLPNASPAPPRHQSTGWSYQRGDHIDRHRSPGAGQRKERGKKPREPNT